MNLSFKRQRNDQDDRASCYFFNYLYYLFVVSAFVLLPGSTEGGGAKKHFTAVISGTSTYVTAVKCHFPHEKNFSDQDVPHIDRKLWTTGIQRCKSQTGLALISEARRGNVRRGSSG